MIGRSDSSFEHDDVLDQLPAYVNRTLGLQTHRGIADHLLGCKSCAQAAAAWSAIAGGVLLAERSADRHPFGVLTAFPQRPVEPELEKTMIGTIALVPQGRTVTATWSGIEQSFARVARYASIAAIVAIVILGTAGLTRFRPSGGGAGLPAAVVSQQDACTAEAPADASLAAPLDITGTLSGTTTNLGDWLAPAVAIDPNAMPAGTPPAQADADAVNTLWQSFVDCWSSDQAKAYGYLSTDGVRRLYFRNVYTSLTTFVMIQNENDPKLVDVDVDPGKATEIAAEKGTPEPGSDAANYVAAKPGDFAAGDLIQLADGRIVLGLTKEGDAAGSSLRGYAVFVKSGDTWLVDDFGFFYG